MIASPSRLQGQFPLDIKRKFWKKFLSRNLSILLLLAFIVGIFSYITHLAAENGLTHISVIRYIYSGSILIFLLRTIYEVWYIKTYIKNYYYSADENFITIKKGVFAPTEIHVQYQKIQDVYVDQDAADRLFFGLYDVHIASATASSGIEAHIDGVNKENAEGLKNFLLKSIKEGHPLNNVTNTSQQTDGLKPEFKFSNIEEISSIRYPLSKKWFVVTLFTNSFKMILIAIAFAISLFSKTHKVNTGPDLMYTPLIITGVFLISVLGNIIRLFLWKSNYAFKFNEDFIYYKDGVIGINEKHMPYSSIQDVIVSQSFAGRIFGFSRVIIQNATQNQINIRYPMNQRSSNLVLEGLEPAAAQKISDIIRNTILQKNRGGVNGL